MNRLCVLQLLDQLHLELLHLPDLFLLPLPYPHLLLVLQILVPLDTLNPPLPLRLNPDLSDRTMLTHRLSPLLVLLVRVAL